MGRIMVRMETDGGILRYTNVSMRDSIRAAYKVKDFQIQGPDWMGNARFDITAKLPEGAKEDQIPQMLQALLAERFKMVVHRETKEHAVYALVEAKGGLKLKTTEVPAGSEARGTQTSMTTGPEGAHLKATSITLGGLAEVISHFSDRPVVDMTGIKGQYDFDLVFSADTVAGTRNDGGGAAVPASGEPHSSDLAEKAGSIYDSVKPYGLRLEPRKADMQILVIDRIEKTPTEN